MMRLLMLDTCGAVGGVALAQDGALLHAVEISGRSFSERLIPAMREVLAVGELALTDVDAIVVVNGPGSFTGVRIGVSAVKALAQAAGRPVIALSRLAVLAGKGAAQNADALRASESSVVHAALDAGRGELYYGRYRVNSNELVCERESLLTRDELAEELAQEPSALLVCEDATTRALAEWSLQIVAEPVAADMLPLAMHAFAGCTFTDVALLDGNYVRRSEVEMLAKLRLAEARRAAR